MAVEQTLLELMNQRQRQILVHSCIYYHFNNNVVPDHQYDAWGRELAALIVNNPATFERSAYYKDFIGYTGNTGFDLPMMRPPIPAHAKSILGLPPYDKIKPYKHK